MLPPSIWAVTASFEVLATAFETLYAVWLLTLLPAPTLASGLLTPPLLAVLTWVSVPLLPASSWPIAFPVSPVPRITSATVAPMPRVPPAPAVPVDALTFLVLCASTETSLPATLRMLATIWAVVLLLRTTTLAPAPMPALPPPPPAPALGVTLTVSTALTETLPDDVATSLPAVSSIVWVLLPMPSVVLVVTLVAGVLRSTL